MLITATNTLLKANSDADT